MRAADVEKGFQQITLRTCFANTFKNPKWVTFQLDLICKVNEGRQATLISLLLGPQSMPILVSYKISSNFSVLSQFYTPLLVRDMRLQNCICIEIFPVIKGNLEEQMQSTVQSEGAFWNWREDLRWHDISIEPTQIFQVDEKAQKDSRCGPPSWWNISLQERLGGRGANWTKAHCSVFKTWGNWSRTKMDSGNQEE